MLRWFCFSKTFPSHWVKGITRIIQKFHQRDALTKSSWQDFRRANPTLKTILTPYSTKQNSSLRKHYQQNPIRTSNDIVTLNLQTSWRKTSQIRRARWKGNEYENTVINHWLAYMLGLIISSEKCSPSFGKCSLTKRSNWNRYCWTKGSPAWT